MQRSYIYVAVFIHIYAAYTEVNLLKIRKQSVLAMYCEMQIWSLAGKI
jgi:hypothetical protein